MNYASIRRTERVLDVGVDSVDAALGLAPYVDSVVVARPTADGLASARDAFKQRGGSNAEFVVASPGALPFAEAAFHIVVTRLSGHCWDDVPAAMREMVRVLRPGGFLAIIDITGWAHPATAEFQNDVESLRDPAYRRALMPNEWRVLAERAGLKIEEVQTSVREHDLESWIARGHQDRDTEGQLRRRFLEAPEAARRNLSIRIDQGAVKSFTDRELFLKARAVPAAVEPRSVFAEATWFDLEGAPHWWHPPRVRSVMLQPPGDGPWASFHAFAWAQREEGIKPNGELIVVASNPCEDRLAPGMSFDAYHERRRGPDYSSPIGRVVVIAESPEVPPRIRP